MQNLVPSGSNSLQPSWQSCNASRAWLLNRRIYLFVGLQVIAVSSLDI